MLCYHYCFGIGWFWFVHMNCMLYIYGMSIYTTVLLMYVLFQQVSTQRTGKKQVSKTKLKKFVCKFTAVKKVQLQ